MITREDTVPPFTMFHWSRGWAALPKSDEAGSNPAWNAKMSQFCGIFFRYGTVFVIYGEN